MMYSHRGQICLLTLFCITIFFFSCSSGKQRPVNQDLLDDINKRSTDPQNIHAVDSAVALLKDGDIVVRMGNDITSYMLSQLNQRDKSYSHCGLVFIEGSKPYVYHSIGGEANPDARMRRDLATQWFSPKDNLAFGVSRMPLSVANADSLHRIVRRLYRQKKKFDMNFDLATDDRLYCAEFVYKAVNQAMGDSAYVTPISVLGYTFVGVDNVFSGSHAAPICQIRFK